ncbi:MAG: EipB family protein, partial [Rhodospirillales bacterium]
MTRTTFRGAAAALTFLLAATAAAPTYAAPPLPDLDQEAAARLVPHRALYRMTLKSARGGSGVVDAAGIMHYRVVETCEAWAVDTNIRLEISYAEGADVAIAWSFAGVESKDGLGYRFRMRHSRAGQVVESLKGEARLEAIGAGGEARFDEPSGETIALAPGTLFPTRHLAALIAAAEQGKRFFPKAVFDGASLENPYQIAATITTRKPAAPPPAAAALSHSRVWPVRLAFFPKGSQEAAPEFELGIDYRADGVAQRIEQDYGDFAIDMVPGEIEV